MSGPVRRLAALVPAVLCVLWSLLLTPAPDAPTPGAPARDARAAAASARDLPASTAHRADPGEPRFAPAAVVGRPAAVENPVRIPVPPVAPAVAPADPSVPARGLLEGEPRRERAPPGGPRGPREPRGPPSTRHG
ncbi:hypothetical protein [Streptomyces litmocidini]|uniref:Secreted protein n=1 Tax=Streptomyces litmocidini TaxID=67318 RepID=A0ABW7U8L0_9ACTN